MTSNNKSPELHLISLHQIIEGVQTFKIPHIPNAILNEILYDNKQHQLFEVLRRDNGIQTMK